MKYYLAEKRSFLVPKNKLEKEIQNYIKEIDRTIIEESDIDDFIGSIMENFQKLNLQFPRCTSVNPSFWANEYNGNKDFILSGIDCVVFMILSSKELVAKK